MLNKQRTKGLTSTCAPITRCPEPLCTSVTTLCDRCVLYILINTTNYTTNSDATNNITNNNKFVINNLYLNNDASTN